jgi:hypothetical protein
VILKTSSNFPSVIFFSPHLYPSNIHRYGASTSQHAKLIFDDTQYLLALAFADRAFYGINSPEEFWQLQITEGEEALILRWEDSVKDLPILRNATLENGVSKEPLPKRTFERIVRSVMRASGYFGSATVHAIRRYLGKQLNGTFSRDGVGWTEDHADGLFREIY